LRTLAIVLVLAEGINGLWAEDRQVMIAWQANSIWLWFQAGVCGELRPPQQLDNKTTRSNVVPPIFNGAFGAVDCFLRKQALL
jgi:hypothetical protein